jgi:crotonobetainyl-CoA:carnitine CoA-transferase CaiB-like acyl-CoA transferase
MQATNASGRHGALVGLRVIDLTRVLSGPYCTQMLGDHGADVIKVEPPQGDETRGWGPPFHSDVSAYFLGINRNKRSVTLDLREAAARAGLLRLLEEADVLVENFRPGTMEKWQLGYDVLAARFPRLIYCRISGFGADGPLGGLPGYDAAIQAAAGLMSLNGEPDGPPLRLGVPVVDLAAGLNATIGILMALQERHHSGRGQLVDIALYDCAMPLPFPHGPNFLYSGQLSPRTGNAHSTIVPYDVFETATAPIFLAVATDRQFARLCELLGRPELGSDARFRSFADRTRNREAVRDELAPLLRRHECEALADRLAREGVPCGPVRGLDEVMAHPQTRHREMVMRVGDYVGVGSPIKLGRTPATFTRPPPKLGEHNEELLTPLRGSR